MVATLSGIYRSTSYYHIRDIKDRQAVIFSLYLLPNCKQGPDLIKISYHVLSMSRLKAGYTKPDGWYV